jgi:tripartite-type tricarboxylate transporter receptor subunit TctC
VVRIGGAKVDATTTTARQREETTMRCITAGRRGLQAVGVLAVGVLAALATRPAAAQQYPTKSVRMVLPFAPGGSTDLIARLVAGQLTERLGKQFAVDNRAGAGGTIATEIVLNAAPDGYTLLVVSMAHAVNPHLYKLKYDMTKDFVPIASFGQVASALVVHPSVPAKSVKELLDLAKAKPGSIHIGHAGVGSFQHLAVANFAHMAKVNIVEVPFKGGGPALVDVLGGHSQALISALISSIPHIKSGKLRGLATSGTKRHPLLPDLPTIAEAGVPGYSAVNWFGMAAPKGTPAAVVDTLNKAVAAALDTQVAKDAFAKDASEIVLMSPAQFGKHIADETDKWGKVIKAAGIKR